MRCLTHLACAEVVNMDHLHSLSDKHKLKMDRLRDLARQKEEAEDLPR